jgi:hypothetical protein
MKKIGVHISLSTFWLTALSFFFTTVTTANVTKESSNSVVFCLTEKLTHFVTDENPLSSNNDIPENSSSENHDLSINDVEDSVHCFDIVITTICTIKNIPYNKPKPINHRQSGKLQYNADIVPPPPKF